ncbi:MAG: CHAD domain-containing protein [Candidatus Limnocylindrales bacterium]
MSGSALEVELKFAIRDAAGLEQLLDADRVGGLVAGPWRTVDLVDRYLDTADRAIARGGYAARLRTGADGTAIELKSLADVAGGGAADDGASIRRRRELSGPADPDGAPDAWPDSEARTELLALVGGAPIAERFALQQRRRERDLRGTEGWAVLSLDDVTVLQGGAELGRFAALEVELRGGDERVLYDFAEVLEQSGAVGPAPTSKLAAAEMLLTAASGGGLAAAAGLAGLADAVRESRAVGVVAAEPPEDRTPPAPPAALKLTTGKSPGVSADDALAEAGRKVLRFHFARMLGYEAGTRAGEQVEDLHRMRVATRRMRAAWRLFGDAYRAKRAKRYVAELRTVADCLGAVRDLDVLLDGLTGYIVGVSADERPALEPLVAEWQARRESARGTLIALLDSGAYRRFVADYLGFVETDGAAALAIEATRPHRVRDTAASRIWSAYEQVRAYDSTLAWADLATVHQLRIAGKRLRYALEFFREALGPDTSGLIAKVTALQDHLGALNDADVAIQLGREFLVTSAARLTPSTIEAVGRFLGARDRDVARLRRSLPAAWRPVAAESFRRALGRAVSSL